MTSPVGRVVHRDSKRIGNTPAADIGAAIKQAGTSLWLGVHELAIEDAHHAHHAPTLTVIFSLHGMNLECMPELKQKAGYAMAAAS